MCIKIPQSMPNIDKDIYVDDCISGEASRDRVRAVTDELKLVLNKGGFN